MTSHEGKVGDGRSYRRMRTPDTSIQLLAIALGFLLVLSGAILMTQNGERESTEEKDVAPQYMIHSPILIEGEAELTSDNGITGGDGSPGNPYVIEGWDINISSASTVVPAGIAVSNITSSLVIRNVNVHSGNSSNNSGIVLVNITSCTVEFSQLIDDALGIGAYLCDQIVIQNNSVQRCGQAGIMVMDSNLVIIDHNTVGVNGKLFADLGLSAPIPSVAITVMNTTGALILNNTMSHSMGGLYLISCNQSVVAGNSMWANSIALSMLMCNWSEVHDNQMTRSFSNGVSMLACQNNSFYNNIIALTLSDGSMWTGYGVWLFESVNNSFYHNDFLNNEMSPQAFDFSMSGVNRWNLSDMTGGNYWSDYGGGNYQIDSLLPEFDYRPLLSEPLIAGGPQASFMVLPASGTTSTVFQFDATSSWEAGTIFRDLEFRWDFNGDGSWDTGWLTGNLTSYSYTGPGEYNATLEVMDTDGRTDNATVFVEVESVVIPEFSGMLLPLGSICALFVILHVRRRGRLAQ